jgi:hypothetical protein
MENKLKIFRKKQILIDSQLFPSFNPQKDLNFTNNRSMRNNTKPSKNYKEIPKLRLEA